MSKSISTVIVSAVALAVVGLASIAQAAPSSGMLLGVYAFENYRGLRITDTIPGYSAEGRLFDGDVLTQATTDGVTVYSIRTLNEIEWAKDQIGPNRPAAIEIWRPGVGQVYFWVEFLPVGGAPAMRAYGAAAAAPQVKAMFKTEAERPGARALFQGGNRQGPKSFPSRDNDLRIRINGPKGGNLSLNPGSLFGR